MMRMGRAVKRMGNTLATGVRTGLTGLVGQNPMKLHLLLLLRTLEVTTLRLHLLLISPISTHPILFLKLIPSYLVGMGLNY